MSEPTIDYCIVGAGPIGIELAVEFKRIGASYLQIESGQVGQTISEYAPGTVFFSSPERLAGGGAFLDYQPTESYQRGISALPAIFGATVLTFDLNGNQSS